MAGASKVGDKTRYQTTSNPLIYNEAKFLTSTYGNFIQTVDVIIKIDMSNDLTLLIVHLR